MSLPSHETIAAIATPPGKGGVGIIRISGADLAPIVQGIAGRSIEPRRATYLPFRDGDGIAIDSGIALYFPAPSSYTGEHVLELHGHGGPVVMDMVLQRVLSLGARLARPGEFTERAFLNEKLDLVQAEAVADLIDCSTQQAVRSAQRSLQGLFSNRVHDLLEELIQLRLHVEAAIDFVDEDIDILSDGDVETRIGAVLDSLETIRLTAQQGCVLREGMTVVIVGRPNAGKSSLLNRLAGYDAAIVTDIAGTTRDVLRERIQIDGMPLHVIDTAGLRDSDDPIEREGVRRARDAMKQADRILLLIDDGLGEDQSDLLTNLKSDIPVTRIYNKIDLTGKRPAIQETSLGTRIFLSVKTGAGMEILHSHLKQCMGYAGETQDIFIARRRHLEALDAAAVSVERGVQQLRDSGAAELVAEDLRLAQRALSEITGEFTSDDLLGRIFSAFCIGK